MKKINTKNVVKLFFSAACFTLVLLMTGCNPKDDVISVYDPSYIGQRPKPIVDSIGALNGLSAKLAGLGQLRIYGKNFSPVPSENIVTFDDKYGTILGSTEKTIDVQVPYYPSDTIKVRVAVYKAIEYSDVKNMQLKDPAIALYSDKKPTTSTALTVRSLAFDKQGTLYACVVNNIGGKMGIKKYDFTANKYVDWYDFSLMPISNWNQMKWGSDGILYCVGSQRRIATITADGKGAPGTFATLPGTDGIQALNDMDFDANKTIWTGGQVTANKIYSVDRNKVITSFAFNGLVRAMVVYNGYLYIAAQRDNAEKVYRLKINSSTSLGAEEVYFDVTAKYPAKDVNPAPAVTSLAFSNDGYMYVGLDQVPGMLLVAPNASAYEEFYPPVLQPTGTFGNVLKYSAFKWSPDNYLYVGLERAISATETEVKLLKINTLRTASPDYGLN